MSMLKLIDPALYFAGALSLLALIQLALYLGLRRDIAGLKRSHSTELDVMRAEIERIAAELETANAMPARGASVSATQSGMTEAKRDQALRLYMQGTTPAMIARKLQIGQGEVDLLLKVHRTLADASPRRAAAAAGY